MTHRQRSLVHVLSLLVIGVVLAGCSGGDATGWVDIPPSPGAGSYEGTVEVPLDNRLASRVTEENLKIIDSRLEYLPEGTAWAAHLAYRDEHSGDLERVEERIPEPDAPVLVAEYRKGGRKLLVIGHADADRKRLVVLTALTKT